MTRKVTKTNNTNEINDDDGTYKDGKNITAKAKTSTTATIRCTATTASRSRQ